MRPINEIIAYDDEAIFNEGRIRCILGIYNGGLFPCTFGTLRCSDRLFEEDTVFGDALCISGDTLRIVMRLSLVSAFTGRMFIRMNSAVSNSAIIMCIFYRITDCINGLGTFDRATRIGRSIAFYEDLGDG